ncbi:MAG: AAA family ATPase [Thermoprotei archaeon]
MVKIAELSDKEREAILRILPVQERNPEGSWEWWEVNVPPHVLLKLVSKGIVEVTYRSNKRTLYRLKDLNAARALVGVAGEANRGPREDVTPDQLFDVIVGFDDVKELFRMSLRSKLHHILLVGPPATAKTLFLMEVARLPGSVYVMGGESSKAGIAEVVLGLRPRYLLIDEIDKLGREDQSVLLGLMENGLLKVDKHGVHVQERLEVNVYAAANDVRRLRRELLSRFMVLRIPEYDDETLVGVMAAVIEKREGRPRDYAERVARLLVSSGFKDVRDAVKVARVAQTVEEAERVVAIWKKYKAD